MEHDETAPDAGRGGPDFRTNGTECATVVVPVRTAAPKRRVAVLAAAHDRSLRPAAAGVRDLREGGGPASRAATATAIATVALRPAAVFVLP